MKRKLNLWGLLSLIVWFGCIGFIIYDFIELVIFNATYTWLGVITAIGVIQLGCIAEDYMQERIRR